MEISKDELYGLDDEVPGTKQHNLNWEKIWPRITFRYINVHKRDVILKLIHVILPTKMRLHKMKQINSPLCPFCNVLEDNIHMFLKCKYIQNILDYFKYILCVVCNVDHVNLEKIIYLDFKFKTKKQMNTAIILTVHYISTIWYNRCKDAEINSSLFKANIINHQKLLSLILKEKLQNVFTEKYCNINT